jgi:hypothetical protein
MMMRRDDYSIIIPSYMQGWSSNQWLSEDLWWDKDHSNKRQRELIMHCFPGLRVGQARNKAVSSRRIGVGLYVQGSRLHSMRQYITARILTQGTCSKEPSMMCP